MTTLRQQIAVKKISEIIGKTSKKSISLGNLLRQVGYSEAISRNPQLVTRSKGFKKELKKYGFNVNDAKKVVREVMNTGKPAERLRAAQEVFKVTGAYSSSKLEVGLDKEIR